MSESKGVPAGFVSEAAMAAKIDVVVATLRAWGTKGYGPRRFRLGKRVLYREDGDIRWLEGIEADQPRERTEPRGRGRPRSERAAVA